MEPTLADLFISPDEADAKRRERRRLASRRWYAANKEKSAASCQAWKAANKEAWSAYCHSWAESNAEWRREYKRAYRAKTKEHRKQKKAEWDRANLLKKREHEAKRQAAKRGSTEHYSAEDVLLIMRWQREKCAACQRPIKNAFQIDHIIPLSRGGSNGKRNIQLLCGDCNRSKKDKDPIEFMQRRGKLL